MGLGTKPVWKCDICNHEWLSRDSFKPMRCASCKTPYWNKFQINENKRYNVIKNHVRENYE